MDMSYVKHVLQPGEEVRHISTIHWAVYWPAFLFFLVAVAGVVGFMWQISPPLPLIVAAVAFALGLLSFVGAWFRRWTTELAVTNRRIVFKRGFIRRHTIEMNMDKVESVDVDQSVLGRLLGYGDIVVHGTGGGLEPLRRIDSPIAFRNAVTAGDARSMAAERNHRRPD
jgi:uncharacterized membrane protein YdbT with pleckstrin-like domain